MAGQANCAATARRLEATYRGVLAPAGHPSAYGAPGVAEGGRP